MQASLQQAILDGSPPWVVSPQSHFPKAISNPSVQVVEEHPSHSLCPSHITSRFADQKHGSFGLGFIFWYYYYTLWDCRSRRWVWCEDRICTAQVQKLWRPSARPSALNANLFKHKNVGFSARVSKSKCWKANSSVTFRLSQSTQLNF